MMITQIRQQIMFMYSKWVTCSSTLSKLSLIRFSRSFFFCGFRKNFPNCEFVNFFPNFDCFVVPVFESLEFYNANKFNFVPVPEFLHVTKFFHEVFDEHSCVLQCIYKCCCDFLSL